MAFGDQHLAHRSISRLTASRRRRERVESSSFAKASEDKSPATYEATEDVSVRLAPDQRF